MGKSIEQFYKCTCIMTRVEVKLQCCEQRFQSCNGLLKLRNIGCIKLHRSSCIILCIRAWCSFLQRAPPLRYHFTYMYCWLPLEKCLLWCTLMRTLFAMFNLEFRYPSILYEMRGSRIFICTCWYINRRCEWIIYVASAPEGPGRRRSAVGGLTDIVCAGCSYKLVHVHHCI